jgi:hypothetical protein
MMHTLRVGEEERLIVAVPSDCANIATWDEEAEEYVAVPGGGFQLLEGMSPTVLASLKQASANQPTSRHQGTVEEARLLCGPLPEHAVHVRPWPHRHVLPHDRDRQALFEDARNCRQIRDAAAVPCTR